MTAYLALFRARFRLLLQYREAALAGIGTQMFWGLIKVMILEAFYQQTTAVQPMNLVQVVTYVWLGQAFFLMMPFSANPDPEIRAMIRSGSVAYEMARPVDLYWLWLARAIAARTAPVALRAIPMFAIAVPFLGMTLPVSPLSTLAWVVSMVGALCLVSAFATLITISLLWTISGDGIARIVPSVVLLGSGNILPLPLFPDWAQTLLTILPFSSMADAPFRIYMGHLPPESVFGVLLHQLIWTVLLILAGRALLASGTRRLVVQGG